MLYWKLSISFLMVTISLYADPWGKDADLCKRASPSVAVVSRQSCSPISFVGECLIGFHQRIISPADGPRSHFMPSSSQYTLDAIRTFGFWRGYLMGCDRLMRENSDPWVYRQKQHGAGFWLNYDPVTVW